jgi:hypothetical protein
MTLELHLFFPDTLRPGAFLGRIGDRMGAKSRLWLFMGTMIQALFTMAAALCIWKSGQLNFADDRGSPSWTNALSYTCIGFMSASLGLQGIMGKRVNTQFATTSQFSFPPILLVAYILIIAIVVLTTVWCELMADPKLFNIRHMVISRDHKVIGIAALFLGVYLLRSPKYEMTQLTPLPYQAALSLAPSFRRPALPAPSGLGLVCVYSSRSHGSSCRPRRPSRGHLRSRRAHRIDVD